MLKEKADVEDAEDARGCDKATRDFLVSSFLPRPAFIILLHRSLFNGNNKTPSNGPPSSIYLYITKEIYQRMRI